MEQRCADAHNLASTVCIIAQQFQDFPGPNSFSGTSQLLAGNFTNTIHDFLEFSRRHVYPAICTENLAKFGHVVPEMLPITHSPRCAYAIYPWYLTFLVAGPIGQFLKRSLARLTNYAPSMA